MTLCSVGELAGYLVSALIGVSLGLIGSGGSILTVPVLVFLFGVRPTDATAHSLIIVGITALVAAIGQSRTQSVDFRSALAFAIPSIVGVYLTRRLIMPALPESLLSTHSFELSLDRAVMVAFAGLMLAASLSMIKSRKEAAAAYQPPGGFARLAIQGFATGLVTGSVGAGGGFLIVPALVLLAKVPIKQAVTTSLMVIAANSLIGFVGDLQSGADIRWGLVASITGLAVGGTFVGAYLGRFIPGARLKPLFGYFVLVMGIFIIASEVLNAFTNH